MTAEGLFDGSYLRAAVFRPAHPNGCLIVTFGHRKPDRTGFDPPKPSQRFLDEGWTHLQIQPRFNDWFVNPDTEDISASLAPFVTGFDHIAGIGFSMGGYGALRLSAALNMAQVVAISPQVSIAPHMVPFDRRYREEGRGFDPALGDLATHARCDLQGVVIFDPFRPLDRRHADMIGEILPGMALCRYGFGGHPATDVLRRSAKFAAIQQLVITRTLTPAAVLALHRNNRAKAPAWWRGVAARAEKTGHFALAAHAVSRVPATA